MTDNKMVYRTSFGLLIFTALLAVSFRIDAGKITFLAASPLNWLIGLAIALSALALLFAGKNFSGKQLMAIGMMYAIVPFSFYFSQSDAVNFILLQNHWGIALGLWAIASIALSMGYFQSKNQFTHHNS